MGLSLDFHFPTLMELITWVGNVGILATNMVLSEHLQTFL